MLATANFASFRRSGRPCLGEAQRCGRLVSASLDACSCRTFAAASDRAFVLHIDLLAPSGGSSELEVSARLRAL